MTDNPITGVEKWEITSSERLTQIEVLIKDSYNHIEYLRDVCNINISMDFIEDRLSLAVDEIGRLKYQIR